MEELRAEIAAILSKHKRSHDLGAASVDFTSVVLSGILKQIDEVYINKEMDFIATRCGDDIDILDNGFKVWFSLVCKALLEKCGWSINRVILEVVSQASKWRPLYKQELSIEEAIKKMK